MFDGAQERDGWLVTTSRNVYAIRRSTPLPRLTGGRIVLNVCVCVCA
jgi:hypothetical protein